MRSVVSATTPGEIVVWRGTFAECCPHGQIHFVCLPALDVIPHPCVRRAFSTCRRLISCAIRVDLAHLDVNIKVG